MDRRWGRWARSWTTATHTDYKDHGFLHRLAAELKTGNPRVPLVAENLPNHGGCQLQATQTALAMAGRVDGLVMAFAGLPPGSPHGRGDGWVEVQAC
jgi:hypothetical protein